MRNPKPLTTLDSCFHRNDNTITQSAEHRTQHETNWLCLALFLAAQNRQNAHKLLLLLN
jgi:hypothetical protein